MRGARARVGSGEGFVFVGRIGARAFAGGRRIGLSGVGAETQRNKKPAAIHAAGSGFRVATAVATVQKLLLGLGLGGLFGRCLFGGRFLGGFLRRRHRYHPLSMGRMKKTNPMQQIVVIAKYLSMKKIHLRALRG
jgi:hypothetical protein